MAHDNHRPTRVLLSGVGGSAYVEALQTLKEAGRYFTIGIDGSEYAAGYAFADVSYQVPFANQPNYRDVFLEICRRERPDLIIPGIDNELLLMDGIVAELDDPKPRVIMPSKAFTESVLDKWTLFTTLRSADLPVPQSWLANEYDGGDRPLCVKPRRGSGSRGVEFPNTKAELDRYLAKATEPAQNYVVQERLDGDEYTVSVSVTLDDELLGVVPKRALYKRGITEVAVALRHPAIEELGRQVHERLTPRGPFNVQLMVDADGNPSIFEINPRYSTTMVLTAAAGVDELGVILDRAMGIPTPLGERKDDVLMIRYPAQLYREHGQWPPPTHRGRLG